MVDMRHVKGRGRRQHLEQHISRSHVIRLQHTSFYVLYTDYFTTNNLQQIHV
jgi:hypothetical protein